MRRSSGSWWVVATTFVVLSACGGTQSASEEPAPVSTPPVVERPAEREQVDTRLWYVFWDGIHVLTVYPRPGLVRSEEPQSSFPPFGGQSPYFSVISHYFEQEDLFGPVIAEATSLEDLLARLAGVALVEIEQTVNPVYEL